MWWRRLAWVGALGLAVVAGAGAVLVLSDTAEPTAAEYVANVNTICAEYAKRLDAIAPPGDLSSPGAVVESLQAAIPVLEDQAEALRDLPHPASLDDEIDELFRLTDRSLVELKTALNEALQRALYPMATALTRFGETRDEAKLISKRLGFHC
ncbi:MAG: hypothetical protein ACRC50_10925 [Gaiella sp.]